MVGLARGPAAEVVTRTPRKADIEAEAAAVRVIAKVDAVAVEVVEGQGVDEVVKDAVEDVAEDSKPNLLQHRRARPQPLATPKSPSYISTRYSLSSKKSIFPHIILMVTICEQKILMAANFHRPTINRYLIWDGGGVHLAYAALVM